EEAARVCRAGLERHPSYLSARVTLGRTLIELEQDEEARTELEYVLRSAPENLAAIRGLAEIHQRRGHLGEALRQYQTALGIAKHDPELEESIHDLSRQLGSASPAGATVIQPPPIPFEATNLAPPPEIETFAPRTADAHPDPAGDSAASLSAELEAAADEFSKALEALDALSIDLPAPSLPTRDPETAHARFLDDSAPADAGQSPVEVSGGAPNTPDEGPLADPIAPPAAEPLPDIVMRADPPAGDRAVVNDLESWLDAIELDREARSAHRRS
ncbi:MAG: hypothetical protein ACRD26_15605, partial [Vicinamibacterales bacterium]